MSVYYNEHDPFAAEWLRNLIAAGELPAGDVDERDIQDVRAADLIGYVQCHFFAGIGGWPLALRLAGWPDDRPVWTGSCPCQPFSAAGRGLGEADQRHLWPEFRRLIQARRPSVVFGEQVASADVVGAELEASFVNAVREGRFAVANRIAHKLARSKTLHFNSRWVDGVRADLEAEDYAFGFEVLGAHSAGAPHIRQRLFWVAESDGGRWDGRPASERWSPGHDATRSSRGLEHTDGRGREGSSLRLQPGQPRPAVSDAGGPGAIDGLGDTSKLGRVDHGAVDASANPWADGVLVLCRDGKARRIPTQPGLQPLAHGSTGRVGQLRAYGNAIVPQVAAEFVRAYLET